MRPGSITKIVQIGIFRAGQEEGGFQNVSGTGAGQPGRWEGVASEGVPGSVCLLIVSVLIGAGLLVDPGQ